MLKRCCLFFLLALVVLTACQPGAKAGEPIFTLAAIDADPITFTMQDLKAMPVTEGYGGMKFSTGEFETPKHYKGVALKDLVAKLGGIDPTTGITMTASDGYTISFSYRQIMEGSFITYDSTTGEELANKPAVTAILAYEVDGEPFDVEKVGNLRLVIVSQQAVQVTDGHWWVKYIASMQAKAMDEDWFLAINGVVSENMDRATFESGSSENCHGTTWTDSHAMRWVGIPLWLLVGRVDNDNVHTGKAYDEALALAGYTVDVITADGQTITFESTRINRNNDIIVAYQVNETALPDEYFPLRLVGSGLRDRKSVV